MPKELSDEFWPPDGEGGDWYWQVVGGRTKMPKELSDEFWPPDGEGDGRYW